jgi:hypothetical protein
MVSGFRSPQRSECFRGSIIFGLGKTNGDAGFGACDLMKIEALSGSRKAAWTRVS